MGKFLKIRGTFEGDIVLQRGPIGFRLQGLPKVRGYSLGSVLGSPLFWEKLP